MVVPLKESTSRVEFGKKNEPFVMFFFFGRHSFNFIKNLDGMFYSCYGLKNSSNVKELSRKSFSAESDIMS